MHLPKSKIFHSWLKIRASGSQRSVPNLLSLRSDRYLSPEGGVSEPHFSKPSQQMQDRKVHGDYATPPGADCSSSQHEQRAPSTHTSELSAAAFGAGSLRRCPSSAWERTKEPGLGAAAARPGEAASSPLAPAASRTLVLPRPFCSSEAFSPLLKRFVFSLPEVLVDENAFSPGDVALCSAPVPDSALCFLTSETQPRT